MKVVELYGQVRHAVRIEGLSRREVARRFGIDPRTVAKMLMFSVPPGYVRKKPPAKPKLDPFISVIDSILWGDKSRPKKEQVKPCSSRSRSKIRFAVCCCFFGRDLSSLRIWSITEINGSSFGFAGGFLRT